MAGPFGACSPRWRVGVSAGLAVALVCLLSLPCGVVHGQGMQGGGGGMQGGGGGMQGGGGGQQGGGGGNSAVAALAR